MSREQNIAQAQREGTFGTIRDKFNTDNAGAGLSMNRFGNIRKMNPPQTTPTGMKLDNALIEKRGFGSPIQPAPSGANAAPAAPAAAPNTGLQDRAAGLRFLREMSQTPLQVTEAGGGKNLVGKYGTGGSAPTTPGKKSQGLTDNRPVAEVMSGLANRQVREGTWRQGDRLPEGMTAEQAKKANEESRQTILSRQRTKK
jgi:hypothetical protein